MINPVNVIGWAIIANSFSEGASAEYRCFLISLIAAR